MREIFRRRARADDGVDTSAQRTGPASPPLPPDTPVAAFFAGQTPPQR